MKTYEVFFGALLATGIFTIGLTANVLRQQGTLDSPPPAAGDGNLALYTFWLVLATLALAIGTVALWVTSVLDGRRRRRETEIVQRAYVSVEPAGIRPFKRRSPGVIGQVIFANVGHLPADAVATFVTSTIVDEDDFCPPPVKPEQVEGARILMPGARTKQGADIVPSVSELQAAAHVRRFMYVWGAARYIDGFGTTRWTTFCHRYNTAIRTKNGEIDVDRARVHKHGNSMH